MSANFKTLIEAEKKQQVSLGIDRNGANRFLASRYPVWVLVNIGTYLIAGLTIFMFIKDIKYGFICLLGAIIYVQLINKISVIYTRLQALKNEKLFLELQNNHVIKIRDNHTKNMLVYPVNFVDFDIDVEK